MNYRKKELIPEKREELLQLLRSRFENNMDRHNALTWDEVEARLTDNVDKLWSLHEMEITGGEPDVVGRDERSGEFIFYDCSAESPKGRRSVCYDQDALESRKKYKPENSAMDMAKTMGVEMLTEEQYMEFQNLGPFDTKTSSWLKTPDEMRELGGAIFGDHRFGRTFIYHNGAESYYGVRGFRASLRV